MSRVVTFPQAKWEHLSKPTLVCAVVLSALSVSSVHDNAVTTLTRS